jgi:hypothetical protein
MYEQTKFEKLKNMDFNASDTNNIQQQIMQRKKAKNKAKVSNKIQLRQKNNAYIKYHKITFTTSYRIDRSVAGSSPDGVIGIFH